MGELPQQLIVQAALILLNAFFAATEIAVISLNTAKLRRLQETGDKTAGRLLRMAEEPAEMCIRDRHIYPYGRSGIPMGC